MRDGRIPGESLGRQQPTPMRSPVNWALLGLIVERPTYAYDLAQRFERRFGEVLTLSNIGHAYTALGALGERGLVEEIPGTRAGRQPKPRYRATPLGLEEYRAWLVAQAGEARRHHQLFVLALGALAGERSEALAVLSRYEQAWLMEGMRTPIGRDPDTPVDRVSALLGRLIEEDNRLSVGARLEWIEYARQQLHSPAGAPHADGGVDQASDDGGPE
jgi:DNA-binding PadR family transcriptional regulator